MPTSNSPLYWRFPVLVWSIVLATLFATEYSVMLVLPWLLPTSVSPVIEATVDAVILIAVVAPVMWWTVVRPLREVVRLRSRFLTDLFHRIEGDRRSIAHELHDGIGQSLSLLVSGLRSTQQTLTDPQAGARFDRLISLAQTALHDTKRLALGLRPSMLDDLGLGPALDRLVSDIREHQGIEVTLEAGAIEKMRLSEGVETAVFRIIQEALSNAITHGHPRKVVVTVRRVLGSAVLEVADDGCGFVVDDKHLAAAGHLGLTGMRERATLLGGQFSVNSIPNQGTRIRATIPEKT